MSEERTVRRRTIAKGAAWAVPVVTIGAPAPAMAVSAAPCEFSILPGSFKCCANGPDKTMYLNLQLGSTGSCGGVEQVCISDVYLSNGQDITAKTIDGVDLDVAGPVCVTVGAQFTVLLTGVQSCAADLVFVNEAGEARIVKSGNIPGGDEAECVTRAGG
jgi:hypothetical protein